MTFKESIASKLMNLLGFKPVTVGVPVIIINDKKEILLGKRSKGQVFYPSMWSLPGGVLEYGERLENCAIREVKEEMGIDIKIIKKSNYNVQNMPTRKVPFHTIDVPFYAKIIKGVPKPKDETSEVKWFKPSEIKKMHLAYNNKEILKKEGLI